MGKRTRFTNVYGRFAIFIINPQNVKEEMAAFFKLLFAIYLDNDKKNLYNNNKINKLPA